MNMKEKAPDPNNFNSKDDLTKKYLIIIGEGIVFYHTPIV